MAQDPMHHDPLEGTHEAPIPRPEARRFAAHRDDLLNEVRDPEFPVALRGYDRDAVEAYVMRVNQALAELESTRSPESAVKRALDRVGEETAGILERAHETAEDIEARSRSQADDRLERAKREAAEAIAAGEARLRELESDAEAVWQERQKLIDDVRLVATELLAVADSAATRYPVDRAEGPPPGQLTPAAAAESVVDAPEHPFDVEAVAEEDVVEVEIGDEPEADVADEPLAQNGSEPDVEDLPPPDPDEAASVQETTELPEDRD